MKLRKRGLQRIADKMGNRDYYTALQKSIIFFPNFLFCPSSALRNKSFPIPAPMSIVLR